MKNSANNSMKLIKICNNLKDMTGLTVNQVKSFIDLITYALIHDIVLESADNTDGKIRYLNIEIPNIGCITVKLSEGEITDSDIELEDNFESMVLDAAYGLKSPLIKFSIDKTIERIKSKYKSMI